MPQFDTRAGETAKQRWNREPTKDLDYISIEVWSSKGAMNDGSGNKIAFEFTPKEDEGYAEAFHAIMRGFFGSTDADTAAWLAGLKEFARTCGKGYIVAGEK